MSSVLIPCQFIEKYIHLSWRDILWGYERQMLGWSDIVDLAKERSNAHADNPQEVELSFLGKSNTHQIGELLRKLAFVEEGSESKKKWLFLRLAWLFENRDDVEDCLGVVEAIYADFDYPDEISGFVRYMPSSDGYNPSQHSYDENQKRLFDRWESYLKQAKEQLDGPRRERHLQPAVPGPEL